MQYVVESNVRLHVDANVALLHWAVGYKVQFAAKFQKYLNSAALVCVRLNFDAL